LIGFQAVLLLRQHISVHILAYLPHLAMMMGPNGKSGCVCGINMDYFLMMH
jgi:hypothetical protein